jgi:hypothetical protein
MNEYVVLNIINIISTVFLYVVETSKLSIRTIETFFETHIYEFFPMSQFVIGKFFSILEKTTNFHKILSKLFDKLDDKEKKKYNIIVFSFELIISLTIFMACILIVKSIFSILLDINDKSNKFENFAKLFIAFMILKLNYIFVFFIKSYKGHIGELILKTYLSIFFVLIVVLGLPIMKDYIKSIFSLTTNKDLIQNSGDIGGGIISSIKDTYYDMIDSGLLNEFNPITKTVTFQTILALVIQCFLIMFDSGKEFSKNKDVKQKVFSSVCFMFNLFI